MDASPPVVWKRQGEAWQRCSIQPRSIDCSAMETTHFSLDGRGPRYEQIARAVKGAVLEGKLAPESRLPSTRVLAQALGVARKSVVEAYELLAIEGLIRARVGVGTVVCLPGHRSERRAQHLKAPAPSRYADRLRKLPRLTLNSNTGPRFNLQYSTPLANARIFASWSRKVSAAARRLGPGYGPAIGYGLCGQPSPTTSPAAAGCAAKPTTS